jgi:hypothetical protein
MRPQIIDKAEKLVVHAYMMLDKPEEKQNELSIHKFKLKYRSRSKIKYRN